MNPLQIIAHKRDGRELSDVEIAELVRAFVANEVQDYQMSAWAMAVYLRGMTTAETVTLTREMLRSGKTLDSGDPTARVDKHSTGGIGDKSSLIVAPLLACCGLQVPMISGRGLGATGGTLDKLESIPGFRTDLALDEVQDVVTRVGCVITGATAELVPADRKLYALRDVTATVASIPLITASILSKKLAENLSTLVLDVKFGSGAFMKSLPEAQTLARSLVEVGASLGLRTTALVTAMSQPNGRLVGNAVEVDEALETLTGGGPADLRLLSLELAAEVLVMKLLAVDRGDALATLAGHLDSGRAHEKFAAMVAAQGGDLDAPRRRAPAWELESKHDGFIRAIDAERLGRAIVDMGGGRAQLGQAIDTTVGLEMLVRTGDPVAKGQPLIRVFATAAARSRGLRLLEDCMVFGPEPTAAEPLVAERITAAASGSGTAHLAPATVAPATGQKVMALAAAAASQAYAPYSKFAVGAALLTASGRMYTGVNVENASYGLTICAERVAISAAIAAGERRFAMLAVASDGGAAPCGACRQFAAEFAPDLPIALIDTRGKLPPRETRLDLLLPDQFKFSPPRSN
jgi:pyrimidine-nucleoside phosphorylase